MTTIVSAFISNINSYRELDKYVEYGKKLLTIDTPKVIFMEKEIYTEYFSNDIFPRTNFVFVEKTDNYLYEQMEAITEFEVVSTNPGKDTIEYMFVQCNKTEWVKQAVETDPFNTEQFVWIDFGIYHMINTEDFADCIYKITQQKYDKIRIAGCWDFNAYYHNNYHSKVLWYFAGSVFGGDKTSLCKFADLMKTCCLDFIDEHKKIIWEVNLWYFIYNEHKELFDVYNCGHDKRIIDNY
jgi:hypothetical protein